MHIFGKHFTRNQILWDIPLAQLNQLVHVHLFRNGAVCRWKGDSARLEDDFDSLCAKFAPRELASIPPMPAVR